MAKTIAIPYTEMKFGRRTIKIPAKVGYVAFDAAEVIIKIKGLQEAQQLEEFCNTHELNMFDHWIPYSGEITPLEQGTEQEMSDDGRYRFCQLPSSSDMN